VLLLLLLLLLLVMMIFMAVNVWLTWHLPCFDRLIN
jgi:hypothetical protein